MKTLDKIAATLVVGFENRPIRIVGADPRYFLPEPEKDESRVKREAWTYNYLLGLQQESFKHLLLQAMAKQDVRRLLWLKRNPGIHALLIESPNLGRIWFQVEDLKMILANWEEFGLTNKIQVKDRYLKAHRKMVEKQKSGRV